MGACTALIMVLLVTAHVLTRALFRKPLIGTVELEELMIKLETGIGAGFEGVDGAVDEEGWIGGVFGEWFAVLIGDPAAVGIAFVLAEEIASGDGFFEGDRVEVFGFEVLDIGVVVEPGG